MEYWKCKDFNRTGTVILPKKWREKFAFVSGCLLDLEYRNNAIFIKKHKRNTTNNSRVLTQEGAVLVPKELRNIMGMEEDVEFCLYIDESNECFILKTS